MLTLTSSKGRTYEIDGRYIVWHPETWEDEPALPDIRIPLRIKLGAVMKIAGAGQLDNSRMREMLLAIVPAIEPVIEDMDVNDFRDMFETWLDTYNNLTGARLGESSASAAS